MFCVQFLFWYIAHNWNCGILATPARTIVKTRLKASLHWVECLPLRASLTDFGSSTSFVRESAIKHPSGWNLWGGFLCLLELNFSTCWIKVSLYVPPTLISCWGTFWGTVGSTSTQLTGCPMLTKITSIYFKKHDFLIIKFTIVKFCS